MVSANRLHTGSADAYLAQKLFFKKNKVKSTTG